MGQKSDDPVPDRDFLLFGENVRKYRQHLGWTMRELATRAGIGMNTLARIQRGEPCSTRVEEKISGAFLVYTVKLWSPDFLVHRKYVHFSERQGRWHFAMRTDARAWPLNDTPEHSDPDSIQNNEERLRLGRSGLSAGFICLDNSQAAAAYRNAALLEVYGRLTLSTTSNPMDMAYLCLRGSIYVTLEGDEMTLQTGETLLFEGASASTLRPLAPVGHRDLPPLITILSLEQPGPHKSKANRPSGKLPSA